MIDPGHYCSSQAMQPSGTPQAIYLLLTLATWRGEQRRSRLRQEAGAPQPAPTSGCNYVRPDRHQLTATRTRDTPARPPSHSPGPPASSSAHPSSPAARPGNRPGSGRTQGNARSAQPRTSSHTRTLRRPCPWPVRPCGPCPWPSVPARTLSVAVRAQPTVPHPAPWPRFPSGRYRTDARR